MRSRSVYLPLCLHILFFFAFLKFQAFCHHVLYVQRTFFSHSKRFTSNEPPGFSFSENVFTSPSFLKDILAGCRIYGGQFCFQYLTYVVPPSSGLYGFRWEICCHLDDISR